MTTLLSQTGIGGTIGANATFPSTDGTRIIQFTPQVNTAFSGTLIIETSVFTSPTSTQYTELLSVSFTSHTTNLVLEVSTSAPSIRARIANLVPVIGAMSVVALSATRGISGSKSATPATAIIRSVHNVLASGGSFLVESPVVPAITSDDVSFVTDPTKTVTAVLDTLNANASATTATTADINLLTGSSVYGLTTIDLNKLADISVTASEVNFLSGATSNLQAQLNAMGSVAGLTATSADLNALAGTVGTFFGTDLTKLGQVTSTSGDLNVLAGVSTGASAITSLNLSYLSGLTTNVQTALSTIPSGITASGNDVSLLAGASAGTGVYAGGGISSVEISYLDGLSSNIQTQLNAKRDTATAIGIAEISGASITTTELNSLQGVTSGIQTQFNSLSTMYIGLAGNTGAMTGQLLASNGTMLAPAMAFAGNTGTGMYSNLGNDFRVAIGGSRAFSVGSVVAFGNGTTTGTAQITTSVGTATTPLYSFIGDTGTGMYRQGAGIVGLSGNGANMMVLNGTLNTVTVGNATSVVTVPGKFMGEKVLAHQVGVNGKVAATTNMYTVPAGRTAVVTKILVALTAGSGVPVGHTFRMDMGWNGLVNDLVDNQVSMTTIFTAPHLLSVPKQVVTLGQGAYGWDAIAPAGNVAGAAGASLSAKVAVASIATTFTFDVIVFGYEY